MPTKGERNALLFFAAVALLGAGTRLVRSQREIPAAPSDAALDDQIDRVGRGAAGSRKPRTSKSRAKRVQDSAPPPLRGPLDLDRATEAEIVALPGIGPAIAKRIIGDRDKNGSFGCMTALETVKGIGPATAKRLDSLIVFSGPPRSACRYPTIPITIHYQPPHARAVQI